MTREEAIKVVRNIYQTDAEKEALETLIPELRESEDERIRKWLYDYIERVGRSWDIKPYTPFPYTQILAWIEKQKEPKNVSATTISPSCWAEEPSLQKEEKPAEWSRQSIIDALTKWLTEKIAPLHKKSLDGTITEREEMFMAALLEIRSLVNSPDFQIGKDTSAEWNEEDKPIPQEEFDAAKHESLWGEQKPAELKQGKRIEVGNKVKIHCREDRNKDMLSIYNDKVGEVISIWDAQRNPWGPIIVRLDNGCNNGFHEDELDIFDESPILEKHC